MPGGSGRIRRSNGYLRSHTAVDSEYPCGRKRGTYHADGFGPRDNTGIGAFLFVVAAAIAWREWKRTSQGECSVGIAWARDFGLIASLMLIISPIALMIAISHTLNKLATDSEIIVMNAAGFSPFRLFRPFIYATCVVALLVAFIAAYLAPDGMRRLKQWDAEITADVLTNIRQPGRFAHLDQNLTSRIRERQPGGLLKGILESPLVDTE